MWIFCVQLITTDENFRKCYGLFTFFIPSVPSRNWTNAQLNNRCRIGSQFIWNTYAIETNFAWTMLNNAEQCYSNNKCYLPLAFFVILIKIFVFVYLITRLATFFTSPFPLATSLPPWHLIYLKNLLTVGEFSGHIINN